MKTCRRKVFIGAVCGSALGTAACIASVSDRLATIPIIEVGSQPARFRGQVIRTCGSVFSRAFETSRLWELVVPGAVGSHVAGVYVLPCGDVDPKPDQENCVTGRIARLNESIQEPNPGDPIEVTSGAMSTIWYLRAQCPMGR